MNPINFKGQNSIMGAGQPEYQPLPTMRHKDESGKVTSCWRLSPKERFKLLFTGRIYLTLMTFNKPIQPQLLSLEFPND